MYRQDACWRCGSTKVKEARRKSGINCPSCRCSLSHAGPDGSLLCWRCETPLPAAPPPQQVLRCQSCQQSRKQDPELHVESPPKRQRVSSLAALAFGTAYAGLDGEERAAALDSTVGRELFLLRIGVAKSWFLFPDHTTYGGREFVAYLATSTEQVQASLAAEPERLARHFHPDFDAVVTPRNRLTFTYAERLASWERIALAERIALIGRLLSETSCSGQRLLILPLQPVVLPLN